MSKKMKVSKKEFLRDFYVNGVKKRKKARERNRQYILKYKKKYCCPCGEKDPQHLTFHHYNGQKEINISDLVNTGCDLEILKEEIKKCIVLCDKCHTAIHKIKKVS